MNELSPARRIRPFTLALAALTLTACLDSLEAQGPSSALPPVVGVPLNPDTADPAPVPVPPSPSTEDDSPSPADAAGPPDILVVESLEIVEYQYPSHPGRYFYAPLARVAAPDGPVSVWRLSVAFPNRPFGLRPCAVIGVGTEPVDLVREVYGDYELEPPPLPSLSLLTEIAVIGADGRPFAELFYLIGLVKRAGILVFRRHQANEFCLYFSGLARNALTVNAEMRVDVRLAVFAAPTRAARRGERNGHPNLSKVLPPSMQGRRVRKVVPLQKVARPKDILEHKRRGIGGAFEAIWHGSRKPETKEVLFPIRYAQLCSRVARMVRKQRASEHGTGGRRNAVINLRKRFRDQRRGETCAEILGGAFSIDRPDAANVLSVRRTRPAVMNEIRFDNVVWPGSMP